MIDCEYNKRTEMDDSKRRYTEPAIKVDNISFNYKNIKAVNRLSLEIPRGITLGILGPNGSGKTTFMRLVVGLLQPKTGTISIMGKPHTRKMSRYIGYMPQLAALYSELTISQNVDFFARIYDISNKDKRRNQVEQAIKLVGLWSRRRDSISRLSGGMKQRVSLACAIVHRPLLLFLDEPTVGVDPQLRVKFWEHFQNLNNRGVTIIISSHTMDDAARCDQLVFLRKGKVIAKGTPKELREATGRPGARLEDAFLYFVSSTVEGNDIE